MNATDAAILGLVQGLTEFLPISSTAHLLVAQEWLGVNQKGLQLEVATHLGTVAAVIVYYRRLFVEHLRDLVGGGPGRRMVLLVVVATAMLAVVALAHRVPGVKAWRDDVKMVPYGLGAVGVFMTLTAFVPRRDGEPSVLSSVVMGLAQCAAAIFPGCSRSGSTIGSGLVFGLDAQKAAQFSFLMSVPAVIAGAVKDAKDEGLPGLDQALPLGIAFVVAFASGLLAIHAMLRIVGRGKLHWFGPYCVALAASIWWFYR